MEPITKLLKSKENSVNWNPALRGSLRSAIAGRQYPQARVFAAGWATHSKCLFCLHKLAKLGAKTERRAAPPRGLAAAAAAAARPKATATAGVTAAADARKAHTAKQDKARYKVEASAEQIAEAPVGSLGHRIWKCLAGGMAELRDKWAAPEDLAGYELAVQHRWASRLGESVATQAKQADEECGKRSLVQMGGGAGRRSHRRYCLL